MAGRIKIGPYKPLGVSTQAVPGGGYLNVDASAGNFGPSPLLQLGLQAAQGAAAITGAVAEQLAGDNEATVKLADTRMGETEQALLFDPQNGFLNLQGQDTLTQAPAVLDAYRDAQSREMATLTDDDQRRMFADLADRRLATFSTQVERHTAAERQRWYDTTSERRIASMQADAALHWNDDALLRRSLGTARAEVRDQAERKGWDSALTETALRQQTSRTLASAIGAAVDRDPGRAQALRTRYAVVIEGHDRAALDALLAEAQTRERAAAASTEILNATPSDGEQSTPHWRLRQAQAIPEPAVRAATIRRLDSAAAADEARARTLGEDVLARVLKDGLTDPSQIPVRKWVALDVERRRAIETRLDHNAAGTEPVPNPTLVDELATEMTQTPSVFARRDLVPQVAHLPLSQWQRFRGWQAGLRRNDPATEDEIYAIKRGFQIARQMVPEANLGRDSDEPSPTVTAVPLRAALVEEIDAVRNLNGKSPDDDALRGMVRRSLPGVPVHNVLAPHLDPETVRRLARLPGQVLDEFTLLVMWLFMNSIILQSQPYRMARPQSPPAPTPTDGQQSTTRTPAANVPEVQSDSESVRPRPGLANARTNRTGTPRPPTILKGPDIDAPQPPTIIKGPEINAARPPTILPGPNINAPQLPTILKGPEIDAPRLPTILPGPDINTPQLPTIYASQASPWDDGEWEEHHHIPQETWQYGKTNRIPFSPNAVRFFDEQTVRIPKDEHWSDLHNAYNQAARKALMDYLEKNKNPDETWQDFAGRMTHTEAQKCYEYMIDAILNPPEGLNEEEVKIAKKAREFLLNVSLYVPKKKTN